MSTTVHVQGISHQTSEKEVRDFFSFCGKITSLSLTPTSDTPDATKSASVTFEKETAAKTALLLDNTQLGPSQVHVSTAASLDDLSKTAPTTAAEGTDPEHLAQEDKPRSRIIAEYLAHGYTISDGAIQRAIALDSKHGFSNRFTSALQNFDSKYKATDRAKSVDASYGITAKANAGWQGLNSYFEKALGTPTGQKVRGFYLQGDKQVREVHNEARRLADLKTGKQSPEHEHNEPEKVEGTNKTVCKCGGDTGNCPCAEGQCACASCPKSTKEAAEEVEKATSAGAKSAAPEAASATTAATTTTTTAPSS